MNRHLNELIVVSLLFMFAAFESCPMISVDVEQEALASIVGAGAFNMSMKAPAADLSCETAAGLSCGSSESIQHFICDKNQEKDIESEEYTWCEDGTNCVTVSGENEVPNSTCTNPTGEKCPSPDPIPGF